MIVIDGNDGTGKTTLVRGLLALGVIAQDRGLPTLKTNDDSIVLNDDIYFILDCCEETSQERLLREGKSLTEKYHTIADLSYYRKRFRDIALGGSDCFLINTDCHPDFVLQTVVDALKQLGAYSA